MRELTDSVRSLRSESATAAPGPDTGPRWRSEGARAGLFGSLPAPRKADVRVRPAAFSIRPARPGAALLQSSRSESIKPDVRVFAAAFCDLQLGFKLEDSKQFRVTGRGTGSGVGRFAPRAGPHSNLNLTYCAGAGRRGPGPAGDWQSRAHWHGDSDSAPASASRSTSEETCQ
jgi:hypothetical protein